MTTNNKSTSSPLSANGHNAGRRKSASGLIENGTNGNSEGGLAPIAQDEDLDSNCNEDDEHGENPYKACREIARVITENSQRP